MVQNVSVFSCVFVKSVCHTLTFWDTVYHIVEMSHVTTKRHISPPENWNVPKAQQNEKGLCYVIGINSHDSNKCIDAVLMCS